MTSDTEGTTDVVKVHDGKLGSFIYQAGFRLEQDWGRFIERNHAARGDLQEETGY